MRTQHYAYTGPTPKPDHQDGPYVKFVQLFEGANDTLVLAVRDGYGAITEIALPKTDSLGLAAALVMANR